MSVRSYQGLSGVWYTRSPDTWLMFPLMRQCSGTAVCVGVEVGKGIGVTVGAGEAVIVGAGEAVTVGMKVDVGAGVAVAPDTSVGTGMGVLSACAVGVLAAVTAGDGAGVVDAVGIAVAGCAGSGVCVALPGAEPAESGTLVEVGSGVAVFSGGGVGVTGRPAGRLAPGDSVVSAGSSLSFSGVTTGVMFKVLGGMPLCSSFASGVLNDLPGTVAVEVACCSALSSSGVGEATTPPSSSVELAPIDCGSMLVGKTPMVVLLGPAAGVFPHAKTAEAQTASAASAMSLRRLAP